MILPLIEFHTKTGSLDLARRLCEEGILISAQVDDRYLLPRLISSVAWIERSAGDCEAARDRFVEAVELARGLESGLPSLLGDLGECELALGELAAGRRHMAEGRAAADASGDSRISLCSRIGFGHLDRYQGNLESANEALLEAIDLSLAQGNRFLLAEAVRALSFLTAAVGVAENAIRLRAAADAMVREAGASFDPWPFDQEGERLVEDARATLGLDRSQALVGEGTALSLDEILALARSLVLSPRQSVSIVQ
jgi:hypothetical protein